MTTTSERVLSLLKFRDSIEVVMRMHAPEHIHRWHMEMLAGIEKQINKLTVGGVV